MTKLVDAIRTNDTVTDNGMGAHSTTLNHCVDLFSKVGALRNKEKSRKIDAFAKAFSEDPLTAMKILFWARDVRGGAGERETFKQIMTHMAENHAAVMKKNIHLIPEYGRWEDVLVLLDTRLKNDALELISKGLNDGDGLCGKWMPRPNGKNQENRRWSKMIMNFLGRTPKQYRKLIVELSNTVEQKMCAGEWDKIKYSHVPSKAMSGYMKAFGINDGERFTNYLDSLENGEVKINANALFPYDVLKNLMSGDRRGANLQWEALPDFLEDSQERVLPVVDVSGSMFWPEAKISGDLYAGHVAMSMGLYVSQRNEGPFKNSVINFHTNPTLHVLGGNLGERYEQMRRIGVGGSTNIEATFDLILNKAIQSDVPESEMPTMLLIFSDMQFDQASGARGWGCSNDTWNPTAQELIEKKYADAGYKMPKLVYWQTNARTDNQPVQFDKQGTALVSGFSPSLLSSLLGGKDLSPYKMMMEVIGTERYAPVTV
jgi:hypothetical protein